MYLKLIMIFAIISALGGGYAYHTTTVAKFEAAVSQLEANNRTLKENQVQLELAVNTAEASLKAAEENAKKQGEAMNKLTLKNNQLQKDKDNAMKIFKDHNLTRLARAKPGMIEKRMNAKTANVFRMLENDTKELMDIDDTNADGVQSDATSGVGTGTDNGSTGTTDSNGS
jgi:chromosome segregation ATPase